MYKLASYQDGQLLYWETWQGDKSLMIREGIVGHPGKTYEKKLFRTKKYESVMKTLVKEKQEEGYELVDEDELIEFVVQYPYEEGNEQEALNKRYKVEDILNEHLEWTGNGHADGGEIGRGTTNIFCYVLNPEVAVKTVLKELQEKNEDDDVILAYLDKEEDDYVVAYPKGADFDI